MLCWCLEGRERVNWVLGFALFRAGKMGFTAVGLGFNYWEWDEQIRKWERNFYF